MRCCRLALSLTACVVLLLGAPPPAHCEVTAKLKDSIEKAADAQSFGETASTTAREVDLAPGVQLSAGTGDIDTTGPCQEDIQIFCPSVKPGAMHVAECLSNQVDDQTEGRSEFTAKVSEACKADILTVKMQLVTNINFDVKMAAACKEDAEKQCKYTESLEYPAKVIACLREQKAQLSGKCQQQMTNAQMAAASDYRLDAQLFEACKPDAANVCKDVKPGSGRVNACLREHRAQVSWECQEELFRADVEDADDIRLSVKLFRTCIKEKREFCADVMPGNTHAQRCLEDNRNKSNFGGECRDMLESMMALRAGDFRLDATLRKECAQDVEMSCAFERKTLETVLNNDARVIECLQDYRDELRSPECAKAVHATMTRASDDIRFAASLAEACYEDRRKYCGNVKAGSARVIRCMQDQRASLADECQVTLFDHEVRMSESIDFQLPMKQACTPEIAKFCEGVPAGHARVIRCLQDKRDESDFGGKCKKEIVAFEASMSHDYRLNYRLSLSCEKDILKLCPDSCDLYSGHACGGRVLRCLTEKKENVKAESCRAEVFYFLKMEVNNYGNDVLLAEACRDDVESLCKDVEGGEGRVHDCLRKNRAELTPACRKEELKLEINETANVELRPTLKRACAEERKVFCESIDTGRARVFRCLVQNLGQPDFGAACAGEVTRKLQRRQDNWKLDVNLRTACKDDADTVCANVDHDSDHADMTRCFIAKRSELSDTCGREVSRAAHMSLLVWRPDSAISKVCDADVTKKCLKGKPDMAAMTGKVLECLETVAAGNSLKTEGEDAKPAGKPGKLSDPCFTLVTVAEPPDEKLEFDNNLRSIAMANFKNKIQGAGLYSHQQGVTLTGYSALACFSALCTVILMGARYGYREYTGIKDGYTQVVKQNLKSGDV